MKISRRDWNEYSEMLAKLSQLASDEMQTFLESHGIGNTELIVDVAHALVTKYGEASAAAACNLYDEIAEKQGKAVRSAEPAEIASREKTAGAVYGSLKDSPEGKKLKQIPDRLVKQAAADTMLQNAKRDGAEWAWIPSGDGCAMCMTIASRGWLPASSAQLSGGHASHIHANCKCQFAIRFDKNLSVEGYDPDELKRQYDAAEGNGSRQKINYLRRKQYEKNNDDINAQKRELYALNKNIISGGRITNPDDDKAKKWAENYYEEIRHKNTDCKHIAERLHIDEGLIRKVKDYLFVSGTWYNPITGKNEKFTPDAAIAQSWQRLAEGKIEDIKMHDRTLIQHEIYERQIKAEHPGISHFEAHRLASEKYDYQTEAHDYYASIRERKKNR